MQRVLLRTAAVLLALATAALLVQAGRGDPRPMSALMLARALVIGALFHVGLFGAADARLRWQRVVMALAMLPAVLIMGGIAGEAIMGVARGFPLKFLSTATAFLGLIVYAVAFWMLARRRAAIDA